MIRLITHVRQGAGASRSGLRCAGRALFSLAAAIAVCVNLSCTATQVDSASLAPTTIVPVSLVSPFRMEFPEARAVPIRSTTLVSMTGNTLGDVDVTVTVGDVQRIQRSAEGTGFFRLSDIPVEREGITFALATANRIGDRTGTSPNDGKLPVEGFTEPGLEVVLRVSNSSVIRTTVADGIGRFSFPDVPFNEGVNTITLEMSNSEGFRTRAVLDFILDTRQPVISYFNTVQDLILDTSIVNVTGISDEPFNTIEYIDPETGAQISFLNRGQLFSMPNFSLQEGVQSLEFLFTDRAGNTTHSVLNFEIDSQRPVFALVSPSAKRNFFDGAFEAYTGNPLEEIKAFTTPGSVITATYVDTGHPVYSTYADTDGSFSVPPFKDRFGRPVSYHEGLNGVSIRIQSPAGRVSQPLVRLFLPAPFDADVALSVLTPVEGETFKASGFVLPDLNAGIVTPAVPVRIISGNEQPYTPVNVPRNLLAAGNARLFEISPDGRPVGPPSGASRFSARQPEYADTICLPGTRDVNYPELRQGPGVTVPETLQENLITILGDPSCRATPNTGIGLVTPLSLVNLAGGTATNAAGLQIDGPAPHDGILLRALSAGIAGNALAVEINAPGGPGLPVNVSTLGSTVTVTLGSDATGAANSTARQVVQAINQSPQASLLVKASLAPSVEAASDPYCFGDDSTVERRRIIAAEWSGANGANVCESGETAIRLAAPLGLITEGIICQSAQASNCPGGVTDPVSRIVVEPDGRIRIVGVDLANPRDGVPVMAGDSILIATVAFNFQGLNTIRAIDYESNSITLDRFKPPASPVSIDFPALFVRIDRNIGFVVSDLVTGSTGEIFQLAPPLPARLDVDPDGNPASQNKFTVVSRIPGAPSTPVTFAITNPGPGNPTLSIGVAGAGPAITVTPRTDAFGFVETTARELVEAVNRHPLASRSVVATLTAPLTTPAVGPLNNGFDPVNFYAVAPLAGGSNGYFCPGGTGCHPRSSGGALAVARLAQAGVEPVNVNVGGGHGGSARGVSRFARLTVGEIIRIDSAQVTNATVPSTTSFSATAAGLSTTDQSYLDATITFTGAGALAGQVCRVTGFDGSTQTFTVTPLPSAPVAGDTFRLVDPNGAVILQAVAEGVSGTQLSAYLTVPGVPSQPLSVTQLVNQLTVQLATGPSGEPVTTAQELAAAIQSSPQAKGLFRVSLPPGATGRGVVQADGSGRNLFLDPRRSDSSMRRNFRILSPSRSGIELVSPPNGFVTTSSTVDVTGRLLRNTETRKVVVNGRATAVDPSGRFVFREFPLEPGDTTIQAVAVDQNGRSMAASSRVHRESASSTADVGIRINADIVRDGVLGTSYTVSGFISDDVDFAGRIIAIGNVGAGEAFQPGVAPGDLIVKFTDASYGSLVKTVTNRPTNPSFLYVITGLGAGTVLPVLAYDSALTITVTSPPPAGARVALVERNLLQLIPGDHSYVVSGSIASPLDRQWNQLSTYGGAADPLKIVDVSYLALKNNLAGAFSVAGVGIPLVSSRPFVRLRSPAWFDGSDGIITPSWPGASTGTLTSPSLFFARDIEPAGFGTFEDLRVSTGDLIVTGDYQGAAGPNDGRMLSVTADSSVAFPHQLSIRTLDGSSIQAQTNVSFAVLANRFPGPVRKLVTTNPVTDVSGFVSDPAAVVVADVLAGDVNTEGLSIGGQPAFQFPDGSFVLNQVELTEGLNTIYVRAQSRLNVNNVAANQRSLVHLDTLPPGILGLCIPGASGVFSPNNPCPGAHTSITLDSYGVGNVSVGQQSFDLRGFVTDGPLGTGIRSMDVRINGQPVDIYDGPTGLDLPGTGAFSAFMNLPQGESRLIITASDIAGNSVQAILFVQTPATPPPFLAIDCFVDDQPLNAAGNPVPSATPYGPRSMRCSDDEFSLNPNSPVDMRGNPFAAAGFRGPRFGDAGEYNSQGQTDNLGPIQSTVFPSGNEVPLEYRLVGSPKVTFEGRGLTRSTLLPTIYVNGSPSQVALIGTETGSGDVYLVNPSGGSGTSLINIVPGPVLSGLAVTAVSGITPDTQFDGPATLDGVTDGIYNGSIVRFTTAANGVNVGQLRRIVNYVAATRTIDLEPPLPAAVTAADVFVITPAIPREADLRRGDSITLSSLNPSQGANVGMHTVIECDRVPAPPLPVAQDLPDPEPCTGTNIVLGKALPQNAAGMFVGLPFRWQAKALDVPLEGMNSYLFVAEDGDGIRNYRSFAIIRDTMPPSIAVNGVAQGFEMFNASPAVIFTDQSMFFGGLVGGTPTLPATVVIFQRTDTSGEGNTPVTPVEEFVLYSSNDTAPFDTVRPGSSADLSVNNRSANLDDADNIAGAAYQCDASLPGGSPIPFRVSAITQVGFLQAAYELTDGQTVPPTVVPAQPVRCDFSCQDNNGDTVIPCRPGQPLSYRMRAEAHDRVGLSSVSQIDFAIVLTKEAKLAQGAFGLLSSNPLLSLLLSDPTGLSTMLLDQLSISGVLYNQNLRLSELVGNPDDTPVSNPLAWAFSPSRTDLAVLLGQLLKSNDSNSPGDSVAADGLDIVRLLLDLGAGDDLLGVMDVGDLTATYARANLESGGPVVEGDPSRMSRFLTDLLVSRNITPQGFRTEPGEITRLLPLVSAALDFQDSFRVKMDTVAQGRTDNRLSGTDLVISAVDHCTLTTSVPNGFQPSAVDPGSESNVQPGDRVLVMDGPCAGTSRTVVAVLSPNTLQTSCNLYPGGGGSVDPDTVIWPDGNPPYEPSNDCAAACTGPVGCEFAITPPVGHAYIPVLELGDILSFRNKDGLDVAGAVSPLDGVVTGGENDLLQALVHLSEESFLMATAGELSIMCDEGSPCPIVPENPAHREALQNSPSFQAMADLLFQWTDDGNTATGTDFFPRVTDLLKYMLGEYSQEAINPRVPVGASRAQALLFLMRDLLDNDAATSGILSEPVLTRSPDPWVAGAGPLVSGSRRQNTRINLLLRSVWHLSQPMNFNAQYDYAPKDGLLEVSLNTATAAVIPVLWQFADDPDDNARGIPFPPGSLPDRSPGEKLLGPVASILRDDRIEDVLLRLADLMDPGTGVSDLTAFADNGGFDLGRGSACAGNACVYNYPYLTAPEQANPFTVNPPLLRVISQVSAIYLDANRNEIRDAGDQMAMDAASEALNALFRRAGVNQSFPDFFIDNNMDPVYGTVNTVACNETFFNGSAPVEILLTRLPPLLSSLGIDPREKGIHDELTVTDPDPANLNRSALRVALDALVDDPDVNELSLPDDIDEYPGNPLALGPLPVGTRGPLGGDGLAVSRRSLDQLSEALNTLARFGFDEDDLLTSIFAYCTDVAAGCPKNKGYPYPYSQARLLSNLRRLNDIAFQLDGPFQVGSGVTGIVRFEQSLLREALKNIRKLTAPEAVNYLVLLIARISDDIEPINGSTSILSPEDVAKGTAAARVFADPDNDGDPVPDGLLEDFVPIVQALTGGGITDQLVDLLRAVRTCGYVLPEEDPLHALKDIRGGELLYAQEDLILSLLDPQSGATAGNCPADAAGLNGRGNFGGALDGNPLVGDTDPFTPGVQTRSNVNSGVAVAGSRLRLIEADGDGPGPDTGRAFFGNWMSAFPSQVSSVVSASVFDGSTLTVSSGNLVGSLVTFTSGALANQSRVITVFNPPQVTVAPAFALAPSVGDTFEITGPSADLRGRGIGPGAALCAVERMADEPGGYLETCAEIVERPGVRSGEVVFNDGYGGNPVGVNAVLAADCDQTNPPADNCSFRIRQMREPFNGCSGGARIGAAPVTPDYGPGLGMTLGAFSPIGLEVRGQVETSGGPASFTGDSSFAALNDDAYTGGTVRFGSEMQTITGYVAATRTFTVTPFAAPPGPGDTVIVNRRLLDPNVWRDGYLDLLLRSVADLGAGLNEVDLVAGACANLNTAGFTTADEQSCQRPFDRIENLLKVVIEQEEGGELSMAGKLLLGGEGFGFSSETPVQALLNDGNAREAIGNLLALQGLSTLSASNPAVPPNVQDGRDFYPCNQGIAGIEAFDCQFSQTDWTAPYEGNGINDGTDFALLALEGVLRTLGTRAGRDGILNANTNPVSPRFDFSDDPGVLFDLSAEIIESGFVTNLLPGIQILAETFDSVPQYDSTSVNRIRDIESAAVEANNPRFNSAVLSAINRRVAAAVNGDETGAIWADDTYPDGTETVASTPAGQSAVSYGATDAPDVTEGPVQVLVRTAKLALDEWESGIGKRRSRVVSAERLVAHLLGVGPRPGPDTLTEALRVIRTVTQDYNPHPAHDRSIDIIAPVLASGGTRHVYQPGTNRSANDVLTDMLALWLEDPTDCDRTDQADPAGATLGVQRGLFVAGRGECVAGSVESIFDDTNQPTVTSQHDRILNTLFRQTLFARLKPFITASPESRIVKALPFLGRVISDSSKPVLDRVDFTFTEYTPGVAVVDALVADIRSLIPDDVEDRLDPLLTDDLNRNGSILDTGLRGTARSAVTPARYSVFDDFLAANFNEVDNIVYDCSPPPGSPGSAPLVHCTTGAGAPLTAGNPAGYGDRRFRIGFTATDSIVTLGNTKGLNAAVLDGLSDLIASSNPGRIVNNQLPRPYSARRFSLERREIDEYTQRMVAPANPVSGDMLILLEALAEVLLDTNL